MKIGICAANLENFSLPKDLPFIGVDKGAQILLSQGITPAFAIGDFDSINSPEDGPKTPPGQMQFPACAQYQTDSERKEKAADDNVKFSGNFPEDFKKISSVKILPARKDVTDTHAAVKWAIENGYDEIYIYGATGGRLDHFMAVLILLELYSEVNIKIIDSQNEISLLKAGSHKIFADGYKYFSLYAPEKAQISITGAEYNLENYMLLRRDPLCCSNEIKGECAVIETSDKLLLIKSTDSAAFCDKAS